MKQVLWYCGNPIQVVHRAPPLLLLSEDGFCGLWYYYGSLSILFFLALSLQFLLQNGIINLVI
jgi:hypothetical protein